MDGINKGYIDNQAAGVTEAKESEPGSQGGNDKDTVTEVEKSNDGEGNISKAGQFFFFSLKL